MRTPLAFFRALTGSRETGTTRLLLMSLYLLLVISCYTATKAVRDSLFVIEIGPSQLPYLYIATAVTMAIISVAYPRALGRIGLYALVRLTSVIAVAGLMGFWWLVGYGGSASFYVLYVWVSIFGAITASQAWSVANHVFNAREARRSFAWIGLGGVIGGILGGTLARLVAPWTGTETLLPICAALMLVTVGILYSLTPPADEPNDQETASNVDSSTPSSSAVFKSIKESPYLSMLVVLLVAGVVVEAFIDYEFKSVAGASFDSKDRLTAFFGTIASYGGVLALIIQTLITSRLLKRFGVGSAILLLPSALLAASLVLTVRPTLWAVSILKLIDGSLSYSVHRSGMELLYIPISAKLRASVKGLIDLLVDRAGRALGGLFLLLLTAGLSLSVPALSLVASSCLIVWLVTALFVRRSYVQAFRVALEKKVIEPEALEVRTLDNTVMKALLNALSSPDDRQVLYALDLLSRTHPARWHSRVASLLDHQSPAVRCRTIALLTEWRVPSSELVSSRLTDPDLEVRVEAVRHLSELVSSNPGKKLAELVTHEDYGVVLAAIHAIGKYQLSGASLIDDRLIERALTTTGEYGVSARTAVARALAITRLAGKEHYLDTLLQDPNADVVQEAIRTTAEVRYESAISRLIVMLARAPLRREARQALLKFNGLALSELRGRLTDEQTAIEVRSRIPKVLSFYGTQDVADFLLSAVDHSPLSLHMPLLKALNRMRAQSAGITFETDVVVELIRQECDTYQRLSVIRKAIHSTDEPEGDFVDQLLSLMDKAIGERLSEGVERIFRLLALMYSPPDIESVYFNFHLGPSLRASAIEFLDNLMELPLRDLVMPIIEDSQENEGTEESVDGDPVSVEDALRALLKDDDEWLQTIAKEMAVSGRFRHLLSSKIA
jgi:AAA family ATP:ADP antiporter